MDLTAAKRILLTREAITKAPQSSGVYLFENKDEILYIGKSVNLKARLLSHLENAKLDPKEHAIIKRSTTIGFLLTDSEFKSLLLEAHLIQKYQPKFNRRWMDDKSYLYIKVTVKDEFPKVYTVRKENDGKSRYTGPFPSSRDTAEVLKIIRRMFPFCMQRKIGKRHCFYAKLGFCSPCPSDIVQIKDPISRNEQKKAYRKNIRSVLKVLDGAIDEVVLLFYDTIRKLSDEHKFEEALIVRDKVLRFQKIISQKQFTEDIVNSFNQSEKASAMLLHLISPFFPKLTILNRIECFDISNLSFTDATASMVVFTDGLPDKGQYRKFKIKNTSLQSDFEMLEEVFRRRFKKNGWIHPNLIVVDGGIPQVRRVTYVLNELQVGIPVIGIAKRPDRLVISSHHTTLRPANNHLGFNLLRQMRDESHRFAKKYHLLLRNKRIMVESSKGQ